MEGKKKIKRSKGKIGYYIPITSGHFLQRTWSQHCKQGGLRKLLKKKLTQTIFQSSLEMINALDFWREGKKWLTQIPSAHYFATFYEVKLEKHHKNCKFFFQRGNSLRSRGCGRERLQKKNLECGRGN